MQKHIKSIISLVLAITMIIGFSAGNSMAGEALGYGSATIGPVDTGVADAQVTILGNQADAYDGAAYIKTQTDDLDGDGVLDHDWNVTGVGAGNGVYAGSYFLGKGQSAGGWQNAELMSRATTSEVYSPDGEIIFDRGDATLDMNIGAGLDASSLFPGSEAHVLGGATLTMDADRDGAYAATADNYGHANIVAAQSIDETLFSGESAWLDTNTKGYVASGKNASGNMEQRYTQGELLILGSTEGTSAPPIDIAMNLENQTTMEAGTSKAFSSSIGTTGTGATNRYMKGYGNSESYSMTDANSGWAVSQANSEMHMSNTAVTAP